MKLQLTESQVQNLIKRLDEQSTPTSGTTTPTSGTTTTQAPVSGQTTNTNKNNLGDAAQKYIDTMVDLGRSIFGGLSGNTSSMSGSTSGGTATFAKDIPPGTELMHPLGSGHKVTSGFGMRNIGKGTSKNHKGIDISAEVGSPVYAPADGVVIYAGDTTPNGCGGFVKINHTGVNLQTKFCHLSKWIVAKGDQVKKGQLIAYSGGQRGALYAGNSLGPHLHYEVLDSGGLAMNPTKVHSDMA